ncbi:MAG: (d)CMP kinase [Melioribacteraceae bacterium]|nr:(d)CMP kinase [Melioribacteraceae bacterium]
MAKRIVIAIDGPAGSGKSTAAKYLAEKLGFTYVDTGAMYRAITFKAMELGIVDDIERVIQLTKSIKISLNFENGITRVFVDDEEVTDKIRTLEVNSKVSDISKIGEVRKELVKLQRKLGEDKNLVAEGRDTTTVVFPNADLKIYLTASLEERAKRRFAEFKEKNSEITIDEVKVNLSNRDNIDSSREISPLMKADDAIEFDNTHTSILDEINILLSKINDMEE